MPFAVHDGQLPSIHCCVQLFASVAAAAASGAAAEDDSAVAERRPLD